MKHVDCWIQTYTGRVFTPYNPRLEDIILEDIAHALSLQCRFNGHCSCFYSIAQHSVLVSKLCAPDHVAWGLLHDASEAYLGDMLAPIKHLSGGRLGEEYRTVEARVREAICKRFGLSIVAPEVVKCADRIILSTEKRDLLTLQPKPWLPLPPPLDATICALPWWKTEADFLRTAKELGLR